MTVPALDVNAYMARQFPLPPCWELVAAIYTEHLGEEVEAYKTISSSVRTLASAFSVHLRKSPHGFAQIAEPVDYAVVLMGRSLALGLHHAGICYGGKVLHALPDGTLYQDMDSLRAEYPVMEFWAKGSLS